MCSFEYGGSFPCLPACGTVTDRRVGISGNETFVNGRVGVLIAGMSCRVVGRGCGFDQLGLDGMFVTGYSCLPSARHRCVLSLCISGAHCGSSSGGVSLCVGDGGVFGSLCKYRIARLMSPIMGFSGRAGRFIVRRFGSSIVVRRLRGRRRSEGGYFSFTVNY